MKYYVRDWGRPCGVETKIFTSLAEAEISADNETPFQPAVEEFATELEAQVQQ